MQISIGAGASVLDCGHGWLWIVPAKKKKRDKKHKEEIEPDRSEIEEGLDAALPGLALAHVTEKDEVALRGAVVLSCERPDPPSANPWSLFAQNAPIGKVQKIVQYNKAARGGRSGVYHTIARLLWLLLLLSLFFLPHPS